MSWRWAIGCVVLIDRSVPGVGVMEAKGESVVSGNISAVVAPRGVRDRSGLGLLGSIGGVLLADGGFSIALVLTLLLVEAQGETALLLGMSRPGNSGGPPR